MGAVKEMVWEKLPTDEDVNELRIQSLEWQLGEALADNNELNVEVISLESRLDTKSKELDECDAHDMNRLRDAVESMEKDWRVTT